MIAQYVLLALLAGALLYAILIYNNLVNLRAAIAKAWSNIDVLLKQRHDELPKLVESCKQHMQFERSTLEGVMQARNALQGARARGDVDGVGAAESAVRRGTAAIQATAEAYPELRADDSIRQLLTRITGLENAISDRRELYNEYVASNNARIQQFPDVLVARVGGFQPAKLLQFSAEETRDVDLRALFQS